MHEPELYIPARERRRPSMGLARLWFAIGALFVGWWLLVALQHLGEGQSRDAFDVALFGGLAWWSAWWVMTWIARGFGR